MQALYGYFTALEALQANTREELKEKLSIDPAKHDFGDKPIFEARKKQAVSLFNNFIHSGSFEADNLEPEVEVALKNAIRDFDLAINREKTRRRKEMLSESTSITDFYFKLLCLPVYLERREVLDKEKAENARVKTTNRKYPFINHPVIETIKSNEQIKLALENTNRNWDGYEDEIKHWSREVTRNNEELATFFDLKSEPENPNELVLEFYKKVCFRDESLLSSFEGMSMHWEENRPILKSMVMKTMKSLHNEGGLEIAELSKNGEEDFEFLEMLFDGVVKETKEWDELIKSKVKNWEIERVSLIDRIILKLAIVEMIHSSSIPLKVTINEAIEISKQYSTPKSKQFINGVLDVVSNELTSSGKIRKSGRGLIDNK